MSAFGGRIAASITTREVSRWLTQLDREPELSSRAANAHRAVMHGVFAFGCRADTFTLPFNPVAGTEKRREPDPAEIVTYTPPEVLAIAEAARRGAHRELVRMSVGQGEQEIRRCEDEQDACLIIVAAFSGLRMEELLALHWRYVIWEAQRLHVQRAYALGHEDSPKGRRGRTVPLAEQPPRRSRGCRSGRRSRGTRTSCSARGQESISTVRRSRPKAFDLVNVQAMMGHAGSRTTARYLHARPAAEDAAKLSRIFSAGGPKDAVVGIPAPA